MSDDEDADFADTREDKQHKRLQTSVRALAEEAQDAERPFATAVVHQLTAITHDWITRALAPDLEAFQRHSKRGTIGVEDVQLAARKNETTKAMLGEFVEELAAAKQKKRRRPADDAAAADDAEAEADDT